MSKRQTGAGTIATLILACVFGATMLLSLATGAGVYRRVAERVERGAAERVGLTYLTAKLQSHNALGTVRAGSFGGPDAVFLSEEIEGTAYDTILYVHEGWLKELFCEQGAPLGPEDGMAVTEAKALHVWMEDGKLLNLEYTDAAGQTGTARICLRGGE
ncbi:MAG: DUF4860 domain-containing protein [Oscillospiraceae bacterium]|nr:DUF4860 domain-containing protein [Oscillospiraceae bacterium]